MKATFSECILSCGWPHPPSFSPSGAVPHCECKCAEVHDGVRWRALLLCCCAARFDPTVQLHRCSACIRPRSGVTAHFAVALCSSSNAACQLVATTHRYCSRFSASAACIASTWRTLFVVAVSPPLVATWHCRPFPCLLLSLLVCWCVVCASFSLRDGGWRSMGVGRVARRDGQCREQPRTQPAGQHTLPHASRTSSNGRRAREEAHTRLHACA